MKSRSSFGRSAGRTARAGTLPFALGLLAVAGCSSGSAPSTAATAAAPPITMSTARPNPDPRVGLTPGTTRVIEGTTRRTIATPAAEAGWNLRLLANRPAPGDFLGVTNSDLAFLGNYVLQGNYNGVVVWNVADPTRPTLVKGYLCPASQSDVSVYRNLMFVSGEGTGGRLDCGTQGVPEPVSADRLRGIRIFDITDITNAKYIANVQTCRGSHTHTVVTQPNDPNNVYVYVSGSSNVRSAQELPGCQDSPDPSDPNSSRFRIEVIRVPLANPQMAAIVTSPRIFNDLMAAPQHGASPADTAAAAGRGGGGGGGGGGRGGAAAGAGAAAGGGRAGAPAAGGAAGGGGGGRAAAAGGGRGGAAPDPNAPRPGPNQCHDITTYPAVGLAGGACGGYGLLLDIRDVANPRRVYAQSDSNFALWHSATFSNDGTKVLFSDEWGGGGGPRCRAADPVTWGGNALFRIENNRFVFQSYYKLPAAQTSLENCVAHNGSLIPIPGRDVMIQGWYQGGISVFDWTDPRNPTEIAFYDRGPYDSERLISAGSWSVYWYNGYIYNSEISRGLDVYELQPSGFISQNEIDAAKTVRLAYFNAQEQQRFVWPATFSLARAYLDQLQRSNGLAAARITEVRNELARIEGMSGAARQGPLTQLATRLTTDAGTAGDRAKVTLLSTAVRDLAAAQR